MRINRGCRNCRAIVMPDDAEPYSDQWDAIAKDALVHMQDVPQPLMKFMDINTVWKLLYYQDCSTPYTSVSNLIWHPKADFQKIA